MIGMANLAEKYKISYDLEVASDGLEATAELLKSIHHNHAMEMAEWINKMRRWAREMRK